MLLVRGRSGHGHGQGHGHGSSGPSALLLGPCGRIRTADLPDPNGAPCQPGPHTESPVGAPTRPELGPRRTTGIFGPSTPLAALPSLEIALLFLRSGALRATPMTSNLLRRPAHPELSRARSHPELFVNDNERSRGARPKPAPSAGVSGGVEPFRARVTAEPAYPCTPTEWPRVGRGAALVAGAWAPAEKLLDCQRARPLAVER